MSMHFQVGAVSSRTLKVGLVKLPMKSSVCGRNRQLVGPCVESHPDVGVGGASALASAPMLNQSAGAYPEVAYPAQMKSIL